MKEVKKMKPTLLRIVLCAAMILCIGNAARGQVTQATITKTIDGLKKISAELGDILCVKLEVNNPYSNPVLVDDDLGSALRYIAGTCMLDGASLTPTVSDNMISFLFEPGYHVITYQFQVVQVEASNRYINNVAQVHGFYLAEDEDAVQITLSPYDGFFKWLSSNDYNLTEPLPLGEDLKFTMEINVRNHFNFAMEDLEVRDDLPAEFEVDECLSLDMGGIVLRTMKGKAKKTRWTCTIGDLDSNSSNAADGVSLKLIVSTALNPAGKQHFISPGWYDVAKQVVVKCKDPLTGNELRANTGSVSVYAGTTL
jgi:hypothetical protein